MPQDWTPPLFHEGGCPAPPGGEDPDDSTSANTSTPEEFASQMKQCPDVLEQTAEGLSSDDNATIITTRSGRVVKPVERFGWT